MGGLFLAGLVFSLTGCGGGSRSPIDPVAFAARQGATVTGTIDRASLVPIEGGIAARTASAVGQGDKLRVETHDGKKSADVDDQNSFTLRGVSRGDNVALVVKRKNNDGSDTTVGATLVNVPTNATGPVSTTVDGASTLNAVVAMEMAKTIAGSSDPAAMAQALSKIKQEDIRATVNQVAPGTGTISDLAQNGVVSTTTMGTVKNQSANGAERSRIRQSLLDMVSALSAAGGEDGLDDLLCDGNRCEGEEYSFKVKEKSVSKSERRQQWREFKQKYQVLDFQQQITLPDDIPAGTRRLVLDNAQRVLKVREIGTNRELVCRQNLTVTVKYRQDRWRLVKEEAQDEMTCAAETAPPPVSITPGAGGDTQTCGAAGCAVALPGQVLSQGFVFSSPVTEASFLAGISVTPSTVKWEAVLSADGFGGRVFIREAPRGAEGVITIKGLISREGGAQAGEITRSYRVRWADPAQLAAPGPTTVGGAPLDAGGFLRVGGEYLFPVLEGTAAIPASAPVVFSASGALENLGGGRFRVTGNGPAEVSITLEGRTLTVSLTLRWADPALLALGQPVDSTGAPLGSDSILREGDAFVLPLLEGTTALAAAAPVVYGFEGGAGTATGGSLVPTASGNVVYTATLEGRTLSASVEVYEPQLGANPGGAGVLKGIIRSSGTGSSGILPETLAGVLVQIPALGISTATNANGRYAFTGLPSGTYTVVAARDGVVQQTQTVVIP